MQLNRSGDQLDKLARWFRVSSCDYKIGVPRTLDLPDPCGPMTLEVSFNEKNGHRRANGAYRIVETVSPIAIDLTDEDSVMIRSTR